MAQRRPDEIEYLTGNLSDRPRPPGIELLGGGGKFTPDGAVQHWPGDTFLCPIGRENPAHEALVELQEDLKTSKFSHLFTFLPTSSLHMTVYQGLAPDLGGWPSALPRGSSREESVAHMLERLVDVAAPPRFEVEVDGLFCAYSLTLSGADDAQENNLRRARASLRDATGVTFADFDDYVFHVTFAYLLDWLTERTARELVEFARVLERRALERVGKITLGPIEYCTFDTMHHFETIRSLP